MVLDIIKEKKDMTLKKMKEMFLKYPTRTISFSFLSVIFVGSLLLSLPIANKGVTTEYLNHLFVSVSATCVTGLVPFVVAEQYTLFGQIVIILMIQIGGLGFLTFLMFFFNMAKKRISFSSRLLLQEAVNKSSLNNLSHYLKSIVSYTAFCEIGGALLLSLAFVPQFGLLKGCYFSIFHSISAFCNAGFDVIGSSSLMTYNNSPLVCLTVAALIICGGIGFVVMMEISSKIKHYLTSRDSFKKFIRSFSLQVKMALTLTAVLIVSGTLLVYAFERSNPETLGNMPFGQQIMNAFFQSVTYRTAGFASFDQGAMHEASKLLACFYMFVGGSPGGTAGGIKTITLGIIYLSVRSVVHGKKAVVTFGRSIREELVRQAVAVVFISTCIVATASLILCLIEPFALIDIFFEAFSAFATVGLTANLTPLLSDLGKVIIMILMYIGRIGPISMLLTFTRRRYANNENDLKYPQGDLLVG